jgi:Secretion system C-terminal sorting domain
MKKTLPILFFMSVMTTLIAQTSNLWTPQGVGVLPKDFDILAMSVVNKDVVWAIADSTYSNPLPSNFVPRLLRTVNGGTTWQVLPIPDATARLALDIQAIDATTAWITVQKVGTALGHNVYKTTDGGVTWTSKFNTYAASLFVRFSDAQNGFIWNRQAFAKTTNGGEAWNPVAITGWSNTEGFASAGITNQCITIGDTIMGGTSTSRICMSPDRGTTWKFLDLRPISFFGEQVIILSLAFKDARNGIALGWNQNNAITYLAKTSDGGTTWAQIANYPFTFGSAIEYIRGTNNSYLIADTDGLTAYTTNAGQSWVKIDSTTSACIRFLDKQTGWIGTYVTKTGGPAMYKWNGGGILSSIKVIEAEEISLKLSPNPTSRFLTVAYAADFKPTNLSIYDTAGKLILEKTNPSPVSQVIDLQDFANGIYLVQLKNTEGVVAAQKIVVEK